MKNFKRLLILTGVLVVTSMFGLMSVEAAKNPYKPTSRYGTNCTWYAWKNAYEKGGVVLPGWHNAKSWAVDAAKDGYEVGNTPKSNSIMVNPNLTNWGHVIYIEKVANGKMYLWDTGEPCRDFNDPKYLECRAAAYNPEEDLYDPNALIACADIAPESACEMDTWSSSESSSIKFIYLDSAPKKPATQEKSTTKKDTTKKTTTTTTKAKSNNTYLSSLTIDSIDFDFDKEKYEYELSVKNEVTNITINADAEDEVATVQGFGVQDLEVGENTFEIIVTDEDEATSTYTLKVTRGEEVTTITKVEDNKKDNKKYNIKYFILIGGLIIVFIATIIVTVMIVKKHKK